MNYEPSMGRARLEWLTLASALLLLAGCAGGGVTLAPTSSPLSSPTGAAPSPSKAVPSASKAAPSPSEAAPQLGGQIVFVDDRGASDHAQLYIESADGTNVRQLLVSDFNDQKPSLSPDGTKVAFARYAPEGSPGGGVFVVKVDGTGLTRIDKDSEDPSWSPDGSQIVMTRALFGASAGLPYNVAVWIVNADGTGARQVTLAGLRCRTDGCTDKHGATVVGSQDNQAVWSPDGTRLAFKHDLYTSPEQFSIWTVALDGSDLRRVTPEGMDVGDPAWSPDGAWIAFQSPSETVSSGEQNIYKIHPDGSALAQLTAHLSSASWGQGTFRPGWSPDGSEIVFSHGPGSMTDRASLFVMNADGSGVRIIAPSSLNQNFPTWGRLPGG